MKWFLLFIFGPPILTLILKILIFIVRYGPGFVGAIFDIIGCVFALIGCVLLLIVRVIMAVFHGLRVLFFGSPQPKQSIESNHTSVTADDLEKLIKALENK